MEDGLTSDYRSVAIRMFLGINFHHPSSVSEAPVYLNTMSALRARSVSRTSHVIRKPIYRVAHLSLRGLVTPSGEVR